MTLDFIFGYSDDETVMLDMDETELGFVENWAKRALYWFDLGGYLILESSSGSYHVVFDRMVDWTENMQIVAWVALLSHNEGLQRWHRMQCIKRKSTLQVSPKLLKGSPKIVRKYRNQKDRIMKFLDRREELLLLSENPIDYLIIGGEI